MNSIIIIKTNGSDCNCCSNSKAVSEIVKTSKFIINFTYGALKFIKYFPVVLHVDHLR